MEFLRKRFSRKPPPRPPSRQPIVVVTRQTGAAYHGGHHRGGYYAGGALAGGPAAGPGAAGSPAAGTAAPRPRNPRIAANIVPFEERQAMHLAEQQAIWESLQQQRSSEHPSKYMESPEANGKNNSPPAQDRLVVIHNETQDQRMLRLTLEQERKRADELSARLKWVEEALKRKEQQSSQV